MRGNGEAFIHTGEAQGTRFPLAAVWEEILAGIFSTLGRVEALAACFDLRTGLYTQPALARRTGPAELDAAIRTLHMLVWKDWLNGSLERQQTDLLVYASEAFETVESFVAAWQSARPYLSFAPESANQQERAVFASNLETLLGRLCNQYCGSGPTTLAPLPTSPLIRRVLERLSEAYADPDLSLDSISKAIRVSTRHLGRKWKESMGQSFGEYLADLRMQKALALLRESHFGVKAISVMVGYRDCNYFIRDFRKRMNCTPGQFRVNPRLLQKSR